MATIEAATIVGVFAKRSEAEKAIAELHQAGFNDEQIGFVVREAEVHEHMPEQPDTTRGAVAGAVSGGVLGGVVGAAAAMLIPGLGPVIAGGILGATLGGAALGAATGGFVGSMTAIGISEEDAHYYAQEFESGRTIVTVNAPERAQEVQAILQANGAYNANATLSPADSSVAAGQELDLKENSGGTYAPTAASETTPAGTYAPDAARDSRMAPSETTEQVTQASAQAEHVTRDSVTHHEAAADRPNRNNIPLGSGM